ncbi:MAG: FtsX-like permease family protein [Bacteroidota bacterium]
MIKNYFKIAWRNIMNNKVFSLINIVSLTIGLSASLVIGLMIYYNYTYDNFHTDGDRIYRIVTESKRPDGRLSYNSGVTTALKDAIIQNSNFETVSDFHIFNAAKIENRDANLEFRNPEFIIFTNSQYFDLFDYEFLAGNEQDILSNPNEVILSEERASLYFPNAKPSEIIGQSLTYNDSINTVVTGVVKGFKSHSDIVFQEFVSLGTALQTNMRNNLVYKSWHLTNWTSQLFVKLNGLADVKDVEKYIEDVAFQNQNEASVKKGYSRTFRLQPLNDLHFNPNYAIYDIESSRASKSMLKNLALVAIFLLILGCANFINLNTAHASNRAKEIGIRKTLGGSKRQLIKQFMGETFLLTLCSTLISLVAVYWLVHVFSNFMPKGLSFGLLKDPIILLSIVIGIALVTFLSGFYPAIVLSRFNTIKVLKNQVEVDDKKFPMRKFLTVFQFTIAQVFIIGTLLLTKQINYLLNKDLGFQTEAIISFGYPQGQESISKRITLGEHLQTLPEVKKVSLGGSPPAAVGFNSMSIFHMNGADEIDIETQFLFGDTEFFKLYELELLAGRVYRNDTIRELVINDVFRERLGYKTPQEAIGQHLKVSDENVPIVGVMNNFNQQSLKSDIKPLALVGDWNRSSYTQFYRMHVALQRNDANNWMTTIDKIKNIYQSTYPGAEFSPKFFDETINTFYEKEIRMSKLLNWATGLSILISCLGLLGLVTYTTNRRIKEIGVRKVLGATVLQINTLLCKEFVILVGIAFLVAVPIAYYGVYEWLKDFAFRTSISFWVFLLGGLAMIVFALAVISVKTVRAATANPVNSLRTE